MSYLRFSLAACLAALTFGFATPGHAARCQKLTFSVNDYGKDGPTRDAKALLDTYIATYMKQKGVAKYSVGKKSVDCELYLDLVVFDEHTCKASANVCWK